MNILLLANSDSVFVRDFCVKVLNRKDMDTVILTPSMSENYGREYYKNDIREVRWPDTFLTGIRERVDVVLLRVRERKKLELNTGFREKIDVLHVHYVEPLHLVYFFHFWRKAERRILTFWGSDIFNMSKTAFMLIPPFLKQASYIVFMIENQRDYFQSIFGHRFDDKIRIIDFGNSILDCIDAVEKKCRIEECKRHFDFPLDKLVVHVGYNASKGQQHIEILRRLVQLPPHVLSELFLVFHVSYGYNDDYDNFESQLKDIMDSSRLGYSFVRSYLQGEELAMFRLTSDIFIYGQKTDARSASPLEYVYAGAKFVCPGWLSNNYELLGQAGNDYYIYHDFTHLYEVLQMCISKADLPKKKTDGLKKEAIRKEISWDFLAEKWRELYE